MNEAVASETVAAQDQVIARAGTYYRNARYLIVALMLAAGLWFAYDGFINWPAEQQRYAAASKQDRGIMHAPHTDLDINLNRRFAYGLLPLAPILLAYFLYRSRGAYRLTGSTLYVPGHPPISFDNILALDKSKWARKGIARVEYQLPGGKPGVVKLDDFIYQREPTDLIVARIEAYIRPEGEASAQSGDEAALPLPSPPSTITE
ncbi:MAG TPA: hypothetical protein VFC78_05125 [Tepidisphaeraceae bacterium]|nr:hypothetical protein [Tepidisphaeraceae bacterium]